MKILNSQKRIRKWWAKFRTKKIMIKVNKWNWNLKDIKIIFNNQCDFCRQTKESPMNLSKSLKMKWYLTMNRHIMIVSLYKKKLESRQMNRSQSLKYHKGTAVEFQRIIGIFK
jgi:competence transcription factor ComK